MMRRRSSRFDEDPSEDEGEVTFSEILCTHNEVLPARDFSLDPSIANDLISHILEKSLIFPAMTSFTLEEMIEDMLVALQTVAGQEPYFESHQKFTHFGQNNNHGRNNNSGETELELESGTATVDEKEEVLGTTQEFTVDLAMKSIFVSETVANIQYCIQRTKFNDNEGVFFDDSWIIVLCELQSIRHRKVVIARLACEMYLMPSCQECRVVALVLASSDERGMKGAVQTGTSLATVFSHGDVIKELSECNSAQEILDMLKETVHELETTGFTGVSMLGAAMKDEEEVSFDLGKAFTGIKEDIARRLPHYFDDFSDGLMGYKTKQKLLAAIVFQYFATILPVIALGHSIEDVTKSKLTTKTVIYSQFMGSILYGVLSGNPMMMFQVSSVILLYCKVLYLFAVYNRHDFNLLFGLTCFFSGLFIILAGIFNLANLMVFSRGSVGDMVDVFQTITYVQSVSSDVMSASSEQNCVDQKTCNPGQFVLNMFTLFMTTIIAHFFHGIRSSRLFSASVREFLSDMGTPIGVLGSTILALMVFWPITLEPFKYSGEIDAFQFIALGSAGGMTVTISFLLAIPLSMLIFLDHNLNIEFFADAANKMHKGHAPHLDMLVIGFINAVFGLFGMCPMQGIYPNTPLHIKQMGDVEVTYDQGVQVKTLIRVRDTRLTQLIVGILVGCSTFLLPLPLAFFPRSSLNGLLIVIGYISMDGNNLVDRLKLFFTDPAAFPSNHPVRKIPVNVAHKFTVTQVLQLMIISYVSFSNFNFLTILFPICLGLLIPVRIALLPKIFERKHLIILDPPKQSMEE